MIKSTMKKLVVVIAAVLCSVTLWAQDGEESRTSFKEKLFAGGGFGVAVGRFTLLSLSPQVGYRFNKYLSSGLGFNLQYASQKEKDFYGNDYRKIVQGITGLHAFARFYPVQKFVLQVQPEGNYIFGKQIFYQPEEQSYKLDAEIVPSLLAGGGLVMPTQNGAFLTTVMYDLLQRPDSPYGNRPIVNVTYNFNL